MADARPVYFECKPQELLAEPHYASMGTPELRGAYLHLLWLSWNQDEPCSVPDDDTTLAHWSGLGERGWKRHGARLRAAFEARNGRLVSRWLREKWDAAADRMATNRLNGSKGGRPRKKKPTGNPSVTDRLAVGTPSATDGQPIEIEKEDGERDGEPVQSQHPQRNSPPSDSSREGGDAGTGGVSVMWDWTGQARRDVGECPDADLCDAWAGRVSRESDENAMAVLVALRRLRINPPVRDGLVLSRKLTVPGIIEEWASVLAEPRSQAPGDGGVEHPRLVLIARLCKTAGVPLRKERLAAMGSDWASAVAQIQAARAREARTRRAAS